MAVLALQDWQPPRDSAPSQPPRSMEPLNHNHSHTQPSSDTHVQSQAPAPFPQAAAPQSYAPQPWQPSPQAPAFYPAYPSYFPPQQPLAHQHLPHPHAQPSPYFDPNQHFAQWAYQQMMFNAQAQAQFHAHHQQQQQQGPIPFQQPDFIRSRTPSGGNAPPQQDFVPFQRAPPEQPAGFHPYPRRPVRQGSSTEPPQPPYARADAAGSSSSIGSGSSGRSRTGSNPAAPQQHLRSGSGGPPSRSSERDRERERERERDRRGIPAPTDRPAEPRRPAKPSPLGQTTYKREHDRERERTSSPRPDTPSTPSTPRADTSRTSINTTRQEAATTPAASKRLSISKDDTQLAPTSAPSGLKGRLRRALSFSSNAALENGTVPEDRASRSKALAHANKVNAAASSTSTTDPESPPTPTGPPPASLKGKSRARRAASLFNTKLNASTDNISLSSTVSSASVMIRKLGSMGRLARKNSLMGITGLFKDKDKDKDKKGERATASVTHATAEVDRVSSSDGPDIAGLSPAAKLARQHTLRSNEEAAARQRAAAEEARAREAAAAAQATAGGIGGAPVPVWERGTATRAARRAVIVEDGDGSGDEEEGSESGSDDDSDDGTYDAHHGWDDEEDVTIRVGGVQQPQPPPSPQPPQEEEEEPWAVGLRRSVERTRRPAKGILKNASTYDQDAFLDLPPNTSFARVRSNSYNQAPQEPGPLARIPSPDPDHIDGLHPHPPRGTTEFIPPFAFEDVPRSESPTSSAGRASPPHAPEKAGFFNLTNMNSSAPALSSTQGHVSPPPLAHRSATTPAKRLAFAANLSIYDTFSPLVYDRRSEPATCNRLTPALAQRIKEELNSYKMEEMEVHAASRVHTQFFV